MNITQKKSVMKVLNFLGIKSCLSRSLSGDVYISITYNKFGDSVPFNPYVNLGDSMRIALLMKMDISFGDRDFFIRPHEGATNKTSMTCQVDGCSEAKRVYKVGNQIINCAIAMIGDCK